MDIEIYQISSYIWGRNYNLWCSGCGKHGLDCSLVKRIGFMASQILLASFHSHLTRISRRTHLPFRLDQREVDYIFCICNNLDHQEGTEYQQSSMSLEAHLHQLPPKHTQWNFWPRTSSASCWLLLQCLTTMTTKAKWILSSQSRRTQWTSGKWGQETLESAMELGWMQVSQFTSLSLLWSHHSHFSSQSGK